MQGLLWITGTRGQTVLIDGSGSVDSEVPRDRAETHTPKIVAKRQRRPSNIDEMVLLLYVKGLTAPVRSARLRRHQRRRSASSALCRRPLKVGTGMFSSWLASAVV